MRACVRGGFVSFAAWARWVGCGQGRGVWDGRLEVVVSQLDCCVTRDLGRREKLVTVTNEDRS